LVEDATVVFATLGSLALAVACWRNIQTGVSIGYHVVPGLALLILVGLHLFRARVPVVLRNTYFVVALQLVGFNGLVTMGLAAQGIGWIPLSVIVAWVVFERRQAWLATLAGAATFCAVTVFVVLHGPIQAHLDDQPSRHPTYWMYQLISLALFGILAFLIIRRLLKALVDREAELLSDRDRLEGILEGIQDAVLVLDSHEGRIQDSNRAASDMFGFPREELRGSTYGKVCSGATILSEEMSMEHFRVALIQGSHDFVWRHGRAGGKPFWAEVYAKVFMAGSEKLMLLSIRDIDERINRYKDLERLNQVLEARVRERTEKLERARQELQTFSYAVSHDLRAPLRAASGFAQALLEDYAHALDADGRQALDRIMAGSQRMSRLIEALLELSRIDRAACSPKPVAMEALARECWQKLSPRAGVGFEVDPSPSCVADPELVRQIWTNLMSNAIKFSASVPSPAIRIGHEVREDGIWHTISDNGCGFDMAHAHKLFLLFHRLHGAEVEGEGVGLATVKRILDRVEGAIEARGEVGRGAVFKFRPGPPTPRG